MNWSGDKSKLQIQEHIVSKHQSRKCLDSDHKLTKSDRNTSSSPEKCHSFISEPKILSPLLEESDGRPERQSEFSPNHVLSDQ